MRMKERRMVKLVSELKFEGYSEDTFGEYGITGEDVDNCASMEPIQCIVDCGQFGRIMVIGQYSKASCYNGCWMIGVSKVDEYDDFPEWDMKITQSGESEYSTMLVIDLPTEDFNLTWFKNGIESCKHDNSL